MAYLKALPANTLKIDRTFVQGVPQNSDDCRILRAMIVFGKTLNLKIVIEGVETKEQAKLCREYGADYLQGYLFSKPVSPNDFEKLLKKHSAQAWLDLLNMRQHLNHLCWQDLFLLGVIDLIVFALNLLLDSTSG